VYQGSPLRFIWQIIKKKLSRVYKSWAKIWTTIKPESVRCIERELDELLAFMDCPKKHRVKIRTTNVIERSFREVRRRVRTMNCFTNQDRSNEDNLFHL
jgi:putative transposase